MVTAFKIYQHVSTESSGKQLSHLDFHVEIAEVMAGANHEKPRVRLGGPTARVPDQVRLDGVYHTLIATSQGRCIYCSANIRLMCSKCGKRLHKNVCSGLYHFFIKFSSFYYV